MRNFMYLIKSAMVTEARRLTMVKNPVTLDLDIEDPSAKVSLIPTDAQGSGFVHDPLAGAPAPGLPGRKASGAETRASMKGINDPRAGQMLGDLMGASLQDEISDDEAAERAGLATYDLTASQAA